MAHDVIATCPVCEHELSVTRLHCRECGTTLEGEFSVGRFGRIDRDQLSLLESFLRSKGNLKEMERELGISYPTVRARVEALLRALGLARGLLRRFLAALALQSTLAPHLALSGTTPDVVLVAVVIFGLTRGPVAGALAGLGVGLCVDILRGRELGLFALGATAAGVFAGLTAERVYSGRLPVRFIVALAATLIDQLLVVTVYAASHGRFGLAAAGFLPAVHQALYNGMLTVLVYGPVARAARSREAIAP